MIPVSGASSGGFGWGTPGWQPLFLPRYGLSAAAALSEGTGTGNLPASRFGVGMWGASDLAAAVLSSAVPQVSGMTCLSWAYVEITQDSGGSTFGPSSPKPPSPFLSFSQLAVTRGPW